jgi:ferrochelatase
MEGKEEFLEAGGDKFEHIPCINTREDWVSLVANWVNDWQKNGIIWDTITQKHFI